YRAINEKTKSEELIESTLKDWLSFEQIEGGAYTLRQIRKSKSAHALLFTRESYKYAPDICIDNHKPNSIEPAIQLSSINTQQKNYNWGTAELYKWKAFNGKMSEGVLYKPEDFDPAKKYPLILYFYETHSNDLHNYIPPTPTGSRLNISF